MATRSKHSGHRCMPILHLPHMNLPVMAERFPPYIYSLCPFSAWPFASVRAVCVASVHVLRQEHTNCSEVQRWLPAGCVSRGKGALLLNGTRQSCFLCDDALCVVIRIDLMKYAHTKTPRDDEESRRILLEWIIASKCMPVFWCIKETLDRIHSKQTLH